LKKLISIAIVGPESTGKSSLARYLSEHLNADVVYEFARTYLSDKPQYTYEDVQYIGQQQWHQENECRQSSHKDYLILDTNLDVIRVWEEVVYNTCDLKTLRLLSNIDYDMYLLCYPDLAWEYDPLRELPNLEDRLRIFHMYKAIIEDSEIPYYIVQGQDEARLLTTLEYIKANT